MPDIIINESFRQRFNIHKNNDKNNSSLYIKNDMKIQNSNHRRNDKDDLINMKNNYIKLNNLQNIKDKSRIRYNKAQKTSELKQNFDNNNKIQYLQNINEGDLIQQIYNENDRMMDYVANIY